MLKCECINCDFYLRNAHYTVCIHENEVLHLEFEKKKMLALENASRNTVVCTRRAM